MKVILDKQFNLGHQTLTHLVLIIYGKPTFNLSRNLKHVKYDTFNVFFFDISEHVLRFALKQKS